MTIPYAVRASLGLAALALGASAVSGCAAQRLQSSSATVSTAGASAAADDAQSSTCPGTAPQNLSSNVSGLADQLEPLAATRVLLCVYPAAASPASDDSGSPGGLESPGGSASPAASPHAPTAIVLSKSDQIGTLQKALNALTPPPTQPVSCPMDSGGSILGIFTAGSQETEVLMQLSGCPLVGNGQKTGWVGQTDFISVLSSMLGGSLDLGTDSSASPS
ncbi:hypothetical protein [Actinospica robiniae]|uniref:hypothetical protein n=1 Tax=Actinospica robiniae TaxID=304901 RepID=UPI00041DF889|nr:hypothetical protein [Actinospica robiniae]